MQSQLKVFYTEFSKTFNLFDVQSLCKRYKLQLLAKDCNHTSCIVKHKGVKWYVTADKVERA